MVNCILIRRRHHHPLSPVLHHWLPTLCHIHIRCPHLNKARPNEMMPSIIVALLLLNREIGVIRMKLITFRCSMDYGLRYILWQGPTEAQLHDPMYKVQIDDSSSICPVMFGHVRLRSAMLAISSSGTGFALSTVNRRGCRTLMLYTLDYRNSQASFDWFLIACQLIFSAHLITSRWY